MNFDPRTSHVNRVFHVVNDTPGWAPITHMAKLACRLLEAQSCDLGEGQGSRWRARLRPALSTLPHGGNGGDIFILRNPSELLQVLSHPALLEKRAFRAIWIIDSFWTENLVWPARRLFSRFDLVGYTRQGDGPIYHELCGDRAVFLGWGTDALDLGSGEGNRAWDILRVGRQPEAWDDDPKTETSCAARGLRFHGRPPFSPNSQSQQHDLMQNWYAQAKVLIAHSNLAAPAPYTHPSKDYITARWTDALACGAVIAGVQPAGDMGLIDWKGATLSFEDIELDRNLDQVAQALADWTPDVAANNYLEALRRLDWRWRIFKIADRLGCTSKPLQSEMARLEEKIRLEDLGHKHCQTVPPISD